MSQMNVLTYTDPNCPWSKQVKTWLRRRRIKFEDRDLREESVWRDEVLEKTSQMAVPVIQINEEVIVGFQEEVLQAAINKAKEQPETTD
jgi:glutaredoxin 3